MGFYMNPDFVKDLLWSIANYSIVQIKEALKFDIDGFNFGYDWRQQRGLIMGYGIWKEFIYPELKRMYGEVLGMLAYKEKRK